MTTGRNAAPASVEEVPGPGQIHRDPRGLRGRDDLGVAHGAARLDHGPDARAGQHLEPVGEREERVGGAHSTQGLLLARAGHGQARGVHAVDLAHADPDGGDPFQIVHPAAPGAFAYRELPTPPDEAAAAGEVLGETPTKETVADLLWAVVMLPEFQLVR